VLSERKKEIQSVKRPLLWAAAAGGTAAGALGAVGWLYSSELLRTPLEEEPAVYDLEALAVSGSTVTLPRTPATENAGTWGLEWPGGYGQVRTVTDSGAGTVEREFLPLRGTLEPGYPVRLDGFAFPGDPEEARSLPFRDVAVESELGPLPAWEIAGERDTWAVFVHGRGAERREALRMLPTVVDAGFPALVITYRNDREAPPSPDGFYHLGQTEWRDLEAAAGYALSRGAGRLLLVGYSMGGAIVCTFLRRSARAGRVRAAILDAPVLDWRAVLRFHAVERGFPAGLARAAEVAASWRAGIAWDGLDQVSHAGEFDLPILLFHGLRDDAVPVTTSDAFAHARPDGVTYHRPEHAAHVESWNVDPGLYERRVRKFLERAVPAEQMRPGASPV
jgi:hypothetical protein